MEGAMNFFSIIMVIWNFTTVNSSTQVFTVQNPDYLDDVKEPQYWWDVQRVKKVFPISAKLHTHLKAVSRMALSNNPSLFLHLVECLENKW